MHRIVRGGLRRARQAVIAAAALAAIAPPAAAQLVFDGNVLFNNNASGTLAGQFSGAAGAGAPSCAGGLSAAQLGTVTYTHNLYADPLLPNAPYQQNTVPDFRPLAGSPAFGQAMKLPADGFFQQTCYAGAIGPLPESDWTAGWTYYDSTGANRNDLHLPGMPDPRPVAIYNNIKLYSSQTWSADSNYLVRGQLRIKEQAALTIPAGVVVFEEFATLGTIIVERGGKIFAIGTAADPIIITSDDEPGAMARGHCGGLVIHGRARVNVVNSCAGDSAASEGGAVGFYGGNDDNDDSGTLRYVRVEYSGKEITPNNELNAFTFNGCGRGTEGDYLQAFMGADDSFEWFGGGMDQKYLIGIDGTDDGYDWQLGTRNRTQFVILRVSPRFAPSGTQSGDKGIEADNNEFNFNATTCAGRSNCVIANMTIVGDKRVGAAFPGPTAGINLRRGTGGTVLNSIVTHFKTAALKIDDDATFEAHCVAPPVAPAVFCPATTGVPIASGNVFLVHGAPNPFHDRVTFSFTLPRAGRTVVEIYGADGRNVATLVDTDLPAGPHSLTWRADRGTASGLYFYQVRSSAGHATGKIARVD